MKRRYLILSLLALVLVAGAAIRPALAYFTDNSEADGAVGLTLGSTTEIRESFEDWVKEVQIANTQGKPVWIRAAAYAGQTYDLEISGTGWTQGSDGYWYYGTPVAANNQTDILRVAIGNIPTEDLEFVEFNVAVVYQSTPVTYNEDGTAQAADWNMILDTGTTEGGGGNG